MPLRQQVEDMHSTGSIKRESDSSFTHQSASLGPVDQGRNNKRSAPNRRFVSPPTKVARSTAKPVTRAAAAGGRRSSPRLSRRGKAKAAPPDNSQQSQFSNDSSAEDVQGHRPASSSPDPPKPTAANPRGGDVRAPTLPASKMSVEAKRAANREAVRKHREKRREESKTLIKANKKLRAEVDKVKARLQQLYKETPPEYVSDRDELEARRLSKQSLTEAVDCLNHQLSFARDIEATKKYSPFQTILLSHTSMRTKRVHGNTKVKK
eukprot:scaffold237707_cov48-Prasinocladus_malaysianus.AAC.1